MKKVLFIFALAYLLDSISRPSYPRSLAPSPSGFGKSVRRTSLLP